MADGYGEVVWNESYTVPVDTGVDLCDYPMARNLVMLVVAMAAEEIMDFIVAQTPRRKNWSVTLEDLRVTSMQLIEADTTN